jgi:hypothetical protein
MASVGSGLPSHKSTIVKQLMSNGISNVIDHYNQQFSLGLTEGEKQDLEEYLKSL